MTPCPRTDHLTSLLLTLLSCFSGSLLTDLLLLHSPLPSLLRPDKLVLCLTVWLLLLSTTGRQVATKPGVLLGAGLLREVYRLRKVGAGSRNRK